MTEASFQPQGYLRFDLSQGKISTPDKRRHVVVPAELLTASGDGAELEAAARSWGEEQGKSLASLVGKKLLEEPPERFITELARFMATLGWGWCELEAWGGVLFVVVQHAPRGSGVRILRSFLAGVFSAASGQPFGCVAIADDGSTRFLLTNPESAALIEVWVEKGAKVGDVVSRMLQGEHLAGSQAKRGGR